MRHQQAPTGRSGHIGRGHIGQVQRAPKKLKWIDDPARALLIGDFINRIGCQYIAAPGRISCNVGALARHLKLQNGRAGWAGLYDIEGVWMRLRRVFKAHQRILLQHLDLISRHAAFNAQAEGLQIAPAARKSELVQHRHAQARINLPEQPGLELRHAVLSVIRPQHDAGILPGQLLRRQVTRQVVVFRHKAHVLDRHSGKPVQVTENRIRIFTAVIEHQDAPGLNRRIADTQHVECRIGHPGSITSGTNFCRQYMRALGLFGRCVIYHNDGQAVFVAHPLKLPSQPIAVSIRHGGVALLRIIPTLKQRFGCHCGDVCMNLWKYLESPIQHNADAGKTQLELAYRVDHASLLRRARDRRGRGELIGIQRVDKNTAKATLPQRLHNFIQIVVLPFRTGLIHDIAGPGWVARHFCRCR